ncbi:MAG: LemA family protein [Panacagrimonas sp.]|jgi:LemA protein|nr:LemA family protein [Panacagrimonas sp.]MCC2657063.1 LemA family protein [Panacagrimonas sp.]
MAGLMLLVVLLVLGGWGVAIYNRLVAGRNGFRTAFAQIDVQLQRRHDLIPNLVETAKAYLKHERETLDAVIAARNAAAGALQAAHADPAGAGKMQKLSAAEGMLSAAMGRFMALVESYPDLKANQTMAQLSGELSNTENEIAGARETYNEAVRVFNNLREIFPNSLVSGPFGFTAAEFLRIETQQLREPVDVSFG